MGGIYVCNYSIRKGWCVWYHDVLEPDYMSFEPLHIFSKMGQLRDFYYKNIKTTRWDYRR